MGRIFTFGIIFIIGFLQFSLGDEIDCKVPPKTIGDDIVKCCKDPPSDEIALKCGEKYGLKVQEGEVNPASSSLDNSVCFVDCVFQGMGGLTDGKLNQDKVKTYFEKFYETEPDYGILMLKSIDKCNSELPRLMELHKKNPLAISANKCPPTAYVLTTCAVIEAFKNCPAAYWTTNDSCEETKKFITKCIA